MVEEERLGGEVASTRSLDVLMDIRWYSPKETKMFQTGQRYSPKMTTVKIKVIPISRFSCVGGNRVDWVADLQNRMGPCRTGWRPVSQECGKSQQCGKSGNAGNPRNAANPSNAANPRNAGRGWSHIRAPALIRLSLVVLHAAGHGLVLLLGRGLAHVANGQVQNAGLG